MIFSQFFETARQSPFKNPLTRVQCESSAAPTQQENQSLVVGRTIAAADIKDGDSCNFGDNKYLMLCGIGGILSCGSTHTFIVPLDLVKCRLQVDKAKYKNLFTGFKVTINEEGARGLAKGWFPTLIGYSAQVRY